MRRRNGNFRISKDFLFLIMLQILSSLILILPLLIAIKFIPNETMDEIAYFSFASNLAIGFTKLVLITSLSLNFRPISHLTSQPQISDMKLGLVLVTLQFFSAILLLSSSVIFLLILHIGLLGMVICEYNCQKLAMQKFWKSAFLHYGGLIIMFLILLSSIGIIHNRQINTNMVIYSWASSTFLFAIILVINSKPPKPKVSVLESNVSNVRTYLASDFLLNYGLMQMLYSFGTSLTSSDEMIKYRLLMFLSIPTNIVMQALSTSGLIFIFGEAKKIKEKLVITYALLVVPLLVLSSILTLLNPKILDKYFGSIWIEIPPMLGAFLLMSITGIILSHTSMVIKWEDLTRKVFSHRILISVFQLPLMIFAISHNGALGILQCLTISNLLFIFVNVLEIRRFYRL